jgi:hypothetical protein
MEHDVVPLTGCYARGGSSERNARREGAGLEADPGPRQKSVHVRNAAAELVLSSSAPTNRCVHLHIPPEGICAQH